MSGKAPSRSCEDLDEAVLSYGAVSYTHLVPAMEPAGLSAGACDGQAGTGIWNFPGTRGGGPVSYTHLDVYKRQARMHC